MTKLNKTNKAVGRICYRCGNEEGNENGGCYSWGKSWKRHWYPPAAPKTNKTDISHSLPNDTCPAPNLITDSDGKPYPAPNQIKVASEPEKVFLKTAENKLNQKGKKIERLETHTEVHSLGMGVNQPPNNYELMDKLNTIIDYINNHDTP